MDQITPPVGGWEALGAQIARRQPEAIAYLNQVYYGLFNQSIQQGCGNCYQKAFYRIQKHLYLQQQNDPSNNILTMTYPTRKYLLKPDRSLQTIFGGDTLTNDNLTDEAAEKLLKAHPALIQHFDRHPGSELSVMSSEVPVVSSEVPIVNSELLVASSELPLKNETPELPFKSTSNNTTSDIAPSEKKQTNKKSNSLPLQPLTTHY